MLCRVYPPELVYLAKKRADSDFLVLPSPKKLLEQGMVFSAI